MRIPTPIGSGQHITRRPPIALVVTAVVLCLPVAIGAQPSRPTTFETTSTTSQLGAAGANVSIAPTIKVLNQQNDPLSGIAVVFTVTSGGGTVTPSSVTTTTVTTLGTGEARLTSWRLGNTPGANSVTATLANPPSGGNGPSATFNATGVLVATTVQPAAPQSITGLAGVPVPQPPAVKVKDQFDKPMLGANVRFAVTAGGGSIAAAAPTAPTAVPTALDGVARLTSWTLGQTSGTNKLTATVGQLSAVEFTGITPFIVTASVRRADGTPIASPYVCVGSKPDIDQFAAVRNVGTDGSETFSVPAAAEYAVTASKAGFMGRSELLSASGHAGSITLNLQPGTGGPLCPGTPADGISSEVVVAIAPPPAPVRVEPPPTSLATRLGEKWLPEHGNFADLPPFGLDCKKFGSQFVMVGISGHDDVSFVRDIYVLCAPMLAGGALGTSISKTAGSEPETAGQTYTRQCPGGKAVAGLAGTLYGGLMSGITLMCLTVGPTGLTSNPSNSLSSVGGRGNTPWPPELCPGSRPARGLRVASSYIDAERAWIARAVQMVCEQPVVPLQITR